jgi:hypothetical protein
VARQREPGLDLHTAFLGHVAPSLPQVLGTIGADREVTVLPLLLTAAYHSKADIPRVLARTSLRRVSYGATLGPHPLLLDALDRRLAEADPGAHRDPSGTAVVLAAAGSSDPEANATIARMAARWQVRDRVARRPAGLRLGRRALPGGSRDRPAAGRGAPRRGRHLPASPGLFRRPDPPTPPWPRERPPSPPRSVPAPRWPTSCSTDSPKRYQLAAARHKSDG